MALVLAQFPHVDFSPGSIGATLLTMEETGSVGSTRRRYKYLLKRDHGLQDINQSIELKRIQGTSYVIVSHETRQIDHGTWELILDTEYVMGLPFAWTVETRSSTQFTQTFRDVNGQLILSYYNQEAPRLHQVPAVLGGYEVIMRRYVYNNQVVDLLPLAGCVPSSDLALSPCYGVQDITIPASAALCTSVRFDLTHPAREIGIIEISFSIPKQVVVNGYGAWDTVVIWADANGVTPQDAIPYYYAIQQRAEFNIPPIVEVVEDPPIVEVVEDQP